MIAYAGIGSRQTPDVILELMRRIGRMQAHRGHVLRSGAADGADSAFETGCDELQGRKEIFLPWKGFAGHPSSFYRIPDGALARVADRSFGHPSYRGMQLPELRNILSNGGRDAAVLKLMARNVMQVAGPELNDPSSLVICWTPDGCLGHQQRTIKTGGTGQAISLATQMGIPVHNLQVERYRAHYADLVQQYEQVHGL